MLTLVWRVLSNFSMKRSSYYANVNMLPISLWEIYSFSRGHWVYVCSSLSLSNVIKSVQSVVIGDQVPCSIDFLLIAVIL